MHVLVFKCFWSDLNGASLSMSVDAAIKSRCYVIGAMRKSPGPSDGHNFLVLLSTDKYSINHEAKHQSKTTTFVFVFQLAVEKHLSCVPFPFLQTRQRFERGEIRRTRGRRRVGGRDIWRALSSETNFGEGKRSTHVWNIGWLYMLLVSSYREESCFTLMTELTRWNHNVVASRCLEYLWLQQTPMPCTLSFWSFCSESYVLRW